MGPRGDPWGRGSPSPYAPPGYPIYQERGWDRARLAGAFLLILAVILATISLASGWWSETVTVTRDGVTLSTSTLYFFPGTTPQATCQNLDGFTPLCANGAILNFQNDGLGSLGNVYMFAQVAALLAVVLGSVCVIFMILGAGRRLWGRWHFHTTHLLALFIGLLMVLAPVVLMIEQPSLVSALPSSTVEGGFLNPAIQDCGSATPNDSFWNSCTVTEASISTDYSWGATVGWYLALVSGAAFLAGGALFLSTRPESDEEASFGAGGSDRRASPPYGARGGSGGFGFDGVAAYPGGVPPAPLAATPDSALGYTGSDSTARRSTCASCGHLNLPGAALCTRCHSPLR